MLSSLCPFIQLLPSSPRSQEPKPRAAGHTPGRIHPCSRTWAPGILLPPVGARPHQSPQHPQPVWAHFTQFLCSSSGNTHLYPSLEAGIF